ncbi:MAG TPA: BLUF domain-containing protein [Gemmatimonadaceae bacterium]|jgi:hypothetical protein
MAALHTLVYVSSAEHLQSEAELEEILTVARELNARDDVTGILLYHEGSFMQCLEGDREVIHATYDRIARDPRHHGIVKLLDEPIAERSFPEWQMGYFRAAKSELLALSNERWNELEQQGAGTGVSRGLIALRAFARQAKQGR